MDYLTVVEAAEVLGISRRGVAARLARGDLRGEQLRNGHWLIPCAEVERARSAGRLRPGPKPRATDC